VSNPRVKVRDIVLYLLPSSRELFYYVLGIAAGIVMSTS
jgi:hypothetical protein